MYPFEIFHFKITSGKDPLDIPSGNLLHIAIEHGPVEIVDLPIENGGFFQFAW